MSPGIDNANGVPAEAGHPVVVPRLADASYLRTTTIIRTR